MLPRVVMPIIILVIVVVALLFTVSWLNKPELKLEGLSVVVLKILFAGAARNTLSILRGWELASM